MTIENFNDFYREYIEFSAKVAYRILQNRENAEDISQEVFLHFYKIRKNIDYSNAKMLESLVFTATANKCKDYYKKSWIKRETCLVDAEKGVEAVDERQNPEKSCIAEGRGKIRRTESGVYKIQRGQSDKL